MSWIFKTTIKEYERRSKLNDEIFRLCGGKEYSIQKFNINPYLSHDWKYNGKSVFPRTRVYKCSVCGLSISIGSTKHGDWNWSFPNNAMYCNERMMEKAMK